MIRCCYFEIYNDSIYDLLIENPKEMASSEPLQLNEDIRVSSTIIKTLQKKEFIVRGLKEYVVESYEECVKLLRLGEYNRHYAETRMNHQSSRSHTLFRLHVESVCTAARGLDGSAGTNVIRESVLVKLFHLILYRTLWILLEVRKYQIITHLQIMAVSMEIQAVASG